MREVVIVSTQPASRSDAPSERSIQQHQISNSSRHPIAAGGVAANRCLIGHCCTNPDHAYHRRVVDGGSYIGFDQIGMDYHQRDDVRADNLAKFVHAGYRA
ncbi:hypothetical protein [Bradyrhizobium sp. DASA03007]|uniref:phosphotriesterase family protein n=1 Tax=unclassified Bradyrhizobium TaxID=2631580 RepID=UPI003F709ADD